MERSMVSVLVVANAGGGSPLLCGVVSGPPASQQLQQLQHTEWVEDNIVLLSKQINDAMAMHYKNEKRLYKIEERVIGLRNSQHQPFEDAFQTVFDKLNNLTKKVDKMALEEVALRKAYSQSIAETAALKATVDTLMKQLDEHIIFPALPLPDPTASSTTMEEMTMQLSVVQNDIQDVLEAIRNPPGKRKRRASDQDTEPTMPMNR
jgi:regulator of replication initiation timing